MLREPESESTDQSGMSATDSKEQVIRSLAAARRRGDFDEVRSQLADDIVWHEPGDAAYSGDHRRADEVLSLMRKLSEISDGTLTLEPQEVIVTDDHAAARTRWWAERDGVHVEGNEIGVYRFTDRKIAEAWFWYDGHDRIAHDIVFSFV